MDDDSAATVLLLVLGLGGKIVQEAPPLDPSIATWAMYFPCFAL